MIDPIEKSVTVPLSPDAAFRLFTEQMDTWWPSAKRKNSKIHIPKHKGGQIIETCADGTRIIWGDIIAYDPGRYLAFTWLASEPATIVQISFHAAGDGTRCNLTHGGFETLGNTADAISTSYLSEWDIVLGCYCAAGKIPVMA